MAVKPWFQIELERVTREKWAVTKRADSTAIRCGHGMRIFVPHSPGAEKAFLNDYQERQFVGKVLPAHRPFADVKIPWADMRL